jgi:hypothetical protein
VFRDYYINLLTNDSLATLCFAHFILLAQFEAPTPVQRKLHENWQRSCHLCLSATESSELRRRQLSKIMCVSN